ncbi:MAG: ferrous iron transport protein B [Chloroflexi bacterium HGW-Chloroflexi-6]|nr:MAG: ferrous iron transport protein B [Chloroflexi bacterium HGW-Chloroflexi-6]
MSGECHDVAPDTTTVKRVGLPMIALAGQPNMGKSTLFNLLTGLNQHVGNWPGKTVERREGNFSMDGSEYNLVDLPGTYSLTANSPEEVIAREFILRESPDVVVAVVSAANLERSLYLVSELICLPVRLVVALNMMDVAAGEGLIVEPEVLEAALGVPVVPITATKAKGIRELLYIVRKTLDGKIQHCPRLPEIRADHRDALDQVLSLLAGRVPAPYPPEWIALKLLEGDIEVTRTMQTALPVETWTAVHAILVQHDDAMLAVASGRYEWVGRMVRAAVVRPRLGQISLTERLDRVAAHPVWGLFVLAGILGLVFWLTFTVGAPLQEWLDVVVVGGISDLASTVLAGAPWWVSGLIVDGIIGGVGSVLTFLPILVIFFAAFGLLEDVGYMARAAYVMDNLMHLMGLHGKSFLPLFLGFGCNVPSIMGTRVIDSWPARLLTILIAPLVPCTARMAVVAFLAPAFFGKNALWVTWGLVIFSLATLVGLGTVLNRVLFKGERSAFIMEMPLYHIPNWRTVGLLVWGRAISFVKKAGTVILAISAVIWALSVLPGGDIETSYLAQFGKFFEPVGRLMGFDWRLTVALLTTFPAKENAIATLGVLYGGASESGLAVALTQSFSTATAISFLAVTMLFVPCLATVAVIKQETNSWRWTLTNVAMFLVISILAGILIYNAALWMGL